MPWESKTVEQKRIEFIQEVQKGQKSKSVLCREFGISRPTGDKWIKRFSEEENISNHSSVPFNQPLKTDLATETLILQLRNQIPALGAKKIKRILENEGNTIPCVSTVNAILKRNNCISKEASLAATPYKRFEKEYPNEMWQADFKGHFPLMNGVRCHPLNVLDDCSRFNICIDAKDNEQFLSTKMSFERSFKEFGTPKVLLCDNGNPWGTSQITGYTQFEVWLMKHEVLTVHGRIRHPQTQGKEERFNQTFTKELLNLGTFKDLTDAQKQFSEYREFYNNIRPHEALDMEVPSSKYRASKRKYKEKVVDWEYTGNCEIRKIKNKGFLTFQGQGYFLSEAFGGETVGIYESQVPNCVDVVFRKFRIARVDMGEKFIVSKRCYLLENDPRALVING